MGRHYNQQSIRTRRNGIIISEEWRRPELRRQLNYTQYRRRSGGQACKASNCNFLLCRQNRPKVITREDDAKLSRWVAPRGVRGSAGYHQYVPLGLSAVSRSCQQAFSWLLRKHRQNTPLLLMIPLSHLTWIPLLNLLELVLASVDICRRTQYYKQSGGNIEVEETSPETLVKKLPVTILLIPHLATKITCLGVQPLRSPEGTVSNSKGMQYSKTRHTVIHRDLTCRRHKYKVKDSIYRDSRYNFVLSPSLYTTVWQVVRFRTLGTAFRNGGRCECFE
jgi:hypothetical protein